EPFRLVRGEQVLLARLQLLTALVGRGHALQGELDLDELAARVALLDEVVGVGCVAGEVVWVLGDGGFQRGAEVGHGGFPRRGGRAPCSRPPPWEQATPQSAAASPPLRSKAWNPRHTWIVQPATGRPSSSCSAGIGPSTFRNAWRTFGPTPPTMMNVLPRNASGLSIGPGQKSY